MPILELPRRKRFQIHLSTAIVMMFVAGGVIWGNTTEFHYGWRPDGAEAVSLGWPAPFMDGPDFSLTNPRNIGFNLFVALVILVITWFTCERIATRCWRIHPGTAILLVIVAGALVHLNTIWKIDEGTRGFTYVRAGYGWPMIAMGHDRLYNATADGLVLNAERDICEGSAIFIDGCVAFGLLFGIWRACETIIYRAMRAVRKHL